MNTSFDFMLVAISLAVAIVAVYVSIDLASRIQQAPQALKRDWLFAGALVLGMGIWAMHFVGMLALHAPVRLGYDLVITLASMLPAILAAGVALHLMQRPVLTPKNRWLGGLAMGAGIGAMHYAGMAAMVMLPALRYSLGLFVFSVLFAIIGSALTLQLAHASFHAAPATRQRSMLISALVGGLSIAGMHYLGMAATIIPPDSVCLSGFQGASLPHRYNPWLMALSIAISILASYTALDISGRIRAAVGKTRHYWLAGGGFAMGLGIWSMHFIGMVAMHTQQPVTYDLSITLISVLPALAASGFALYMIARGDLTPRILALSGVLMACGIGAMHYIGMAAMQINPPFRYDATFFALSILVAVAASISALWIGFQQHSIDSLGKSATRKISSAVLMGLAIAGMHYTGMSATHILPAAGLNTIEGLDPEYIAVIAGFATFMVLLLAYVVAFYDARLAVIRAEIAANLRDANAHLEARANSLAERMTAEIRRNAAQDRLLGSIVEQSSEAIITINQHNIIKTWNAAAEAILGIASVDAIGTRTDKLRLPVSNTPLEYFLKFKTSLSDILHVSGAVTTSNGEVKQVSSNVLPHLDATGASIGRIAVLRDVTRELVAEQELRWHATHDPLTELENRRSFVAHIEGARITARAAQAHHALLHIDLDQFRRINDTYGRQAGDQMLIGIAELLQTVASPRGIVARMGGDEFGILLIDCKHVAAVKMVEKLREKIAQFRLLTVDRYIQTSASIGLVEIVDDSKTAVQLLLAADSACHQAKNLSPERV
jgi:diguanylate cyclase